MVTASWCQPAWRALLAAAREEDITLLHAARDGHHNIAAVLQPFLEGKLRGEGT